MQRWVAGHSLFLLFILSLAAASGWQLSFELPGALAQAPPPTVAITSPAGGATVEGTVAVAATSTAGTGDSPVSIRLYDGVNDVGTESCQKQPTCTVSINWRATGLSGPHTLTAEVVTEEEQTATSAPVTVNVVSPPPAVSITSPANGSTVKGTVLVSATAATDPSQEDYPISLTVYDGVNRIGSIECQGQKICQGSVSWQATGLSGKHTLTARVSTKDELSVTSAPDAVTVVSPPPTVRITAPRSGAALGGTITVEVSGATDPSQSDYPTSMEVFDGVTEVGGIECQGQQTCAGSVKWNTAGLKGRHSLTALIHTHDELTARSAAIIVGGSAPHPAVKHPALPRATAKCHLASPNVHLRRNDHGLCSIHGAPTGTHLAVQYRAGSHFVTVVRGRVSSKGRFSFRLRGVTKATYSLTLLIGASSKNAATRVSVGVLHIG